MVIIKSELSDLRECKTQGYLQYANFARIGEILYKPGINLCIFEYTEFK